MGLDIVELIFAVEKAFQIHLEDAECERISTVGQLHELILSKLSGPVARLHPGVCMTSAAFYRTRRTIVDTLGLERRQIKPATTLDSLLPKPTRRTKWKLLQTASQLKLPRLDLPAWAFWSSFAIGMPLAMLPLGVGALGKPSLTSLAILAWLLLLGLLLSALIRRAARSLATEFPNSAATVGDLSRLVLAHNFSAIEKDAGGWSERESWDLLVEIIVRQTGIDRDRITPDASFVQDLGLD